MFAPTPIGGGSGGAGAGRRAPEDGLGRRQGGDSGAGVPPTSALETQPVGRAPMLGGIRAGEHVGAGDGPDSAPPPSSARGMSRGGAVPGARMGASCGGALGDSARETGAKRAADADRSAREGALYARARELELCGPLGERRRDEWLGGDDAQTALGAALVESLRRSVRQRLMRGQDLGRMGTAMSWFEDFLRDTRRRPFIALAHAGDIGAGAYNSETLELLAEYMRAKGSRQSGTALTADHIQATVSTVRLLRSSEAHYGVVVPEADTALDRLYKEIRKDGGPRGERKGSMGFRARHLRVLATARFRHGSAQAEVEWVVALVAHNLLLRGGEVGSTDGGRFDAARDLSVLSVDLREPCSESAWLPWLIVWVVSIKDAAARFRAVPIPVRARLATQGAAPDDLCAYTALKRHVLRLRNETPACAENCQWCDRSPLEPRVGGQPPQTCARAHTPLFTTAAGKPYVTNDVRVMGRRMAALVGMPGDAVGGKLFRVGGATDLRDVLGDEGMRVIKERGRWGSDVAVVYQRATMRHSLEASAAAADADSREVEAMVPGWVQPATFR